MSPDRQPAHIVPLSSNQLRMWLYSDLLPAVTTFQGPVTVRLGGPLNLAAIRAAVDTLAARHEILRTRFPVPDVVPVQLIDEPARVPVRLVDLTPLPAPEKDTALARVIAHAATRPFDFTSAPGWHVQIVRLHSTDHVLVLTMHHMIVDLWSIGLVIDELCAGYRTSAAGVPSDLPQVPVQQAELAAQQRDRHTPERLEARRKWWRSHLADIRPVELPSTRPRPSRPNLTTHVYQTRLSAELSDDLRRSSKAAGVTLYVTALAATAALVFKWSSQTDFAVMSNTAGRLGRGAERVVGTPVEYLVVRVDAGADPTFQELLGRVGRAVLDAFDHITSLDELFAATDPAHLLQPSPLRQLGFAVQDSPRAAPALPGISLSGLPAPVTRVETGISEGDLWLEIFDTGVGALGLRLQLDDRLFEQSSAARTVDALVDLLGAVTQQPGIRLSELNVTYQPRVSPVVVTDSPPAPADDATVEMVKTMVAQLLGRRTVERDDNFFLLGGTPVEALILAKRLSVQCGATVSAFDIELSPTIAGITRTVTNGRRG